MKTLLKKINNNLHMTLEHFLNRKTQNIISLIILTLFLFQSYNICKSYIFRSSIDHHEVEYFSVVNKIQVQTPNQNNEIIYRIDGENILDPGGHLKILQAYNYLLKIIEIDYNTTYHPIVYLRFFSCILLFIIAIFFSLIAYEVSANLIFAVTCLFVPSLSVVVSAYGFIARAFIFEAVFTVASIYFLIHFLKKQSISTYTLMIFSILGCMWIRYSGTFITSLSIIVILYLSINKIRNEKYFYYTIVLIGINALFILSTNLNNIIHIKAKTVHLNDDYLLNNILDLNYGAILDKLNSPELLTYSFAILLFLLKNNGNKVNLSFMLFLITSILYLVSSFTGLYPFNLNERHSISLHITFLVFFIYEVYELLTHLSLPYKSFYLYTILVLLYSLFQFPNIIFEEWNSKMCQIDIKSRNSIIMKYKNKIFSASAWAEEWYHLNHGTLAGSPGKELLYASTKVIPNEFTFTNPLENDTIYISKENSRNLNLKSQKHSRNISFIINFPSCTSFINNIYTSR